MPMVDARNLEWESFDEIIEAINMAYEEGNLTEAAELNYAADQWIQEEADAIYDSSPLTVQDVRTIRVASTFLPTKYTLEIRDVA